MKNITKNIYLILILIIIPFNLFSKDSWEIYKHDEIEFSVPPNWNVISHPDEFMKIKVVPDRFDDGTFFSFIERSPTSIDFSWDDIKNQNTLKEVAIAFKSVLENMGLMVTLKSYEIVKLDNKETFDIKYEIEDDFGIKFVARYVCIYSTPYSYMFMAIFPLLQARTTGLMMDKIIQSIKINDYKVPRDLLPQSYDANIKIIKQQLEFVLSVKKSGWVWSVNSMKMGAGSHSKDLFVQLKLDRNDATDLVEGFEKTLSALKIGVDPSRFMNKNDEETGKQFFYQIGMILGAMINSYNNKSLPIKHFYIEISDKYGSRALKKIVVDVDIFLKLMKSNPEQMFLKGINFE